MMKRSGLVGWMMLAGLVGILHYLTGQRGGFAGYLVSLGIVVAVSGAFRLGPFKALLWVSVATLLIGFVGSYFGVITGNLGPHPNTVLLDLTGHLFFAAIAVILGFLIVMRWKPMRHRIPRLKPILALLFTLSLVPVMAVLFLIVWAGKSFRIPYPREPALTFGKAINAFTSGRLMVWAHGQKK